MASQALYRKWRSRTFDEIIGQEHVTQTLINALKLDRVAHAYLFSGPRGTGKTSTARLLAKAVNCMAEDTSLRPCNQCPICVAVNEGRLMDLIEIDAASNTGVDDIRDLRDKVGFRPAEAKVKFYIIDEVHMLSNSAFNALLKTLEEPPRHVIFVLATTEPEKIPATITSRCQRFDFKRIKLDDIVDRLNYIISQEGFEADKEALEIIARQGSGSMRDAISLLDQMVAYGGEKIGLALVRSVLGSGASDAVIELVDVLLDEDVAAGIDIINRVVGDGFDPRQFAYEIVEHLRAVMLTKFGNDAVLLDLPEETLDAVKRQAQVADVSQLVRSTLQFNSASIDIKSGLLAIPQLQLELAFIESAVPSAVHAPAVSAPPDAVPTASVSSTSIRTREAADRSSVESGSSHVPVQPSPPIPPLPPAELSDGALDFETVQRRFDHVLKIIEPKSRAMAEALRSCQLHRVAGNEVYFVTFDLMKEKFEKPKPKAALNNAFSQVLGKAVVVRFVTERDVGMNTRGLSLSSSSTQDEKDSIGALIKVATEELGGEIVED